MKIRPVGADLCADRRTDMTKLMVAFRHYAKAPNNWHQQWIVLQIVEHLNDSLSLAFYCTTGALCSLQKSHL